jgi:hypothetical protein
MSKITSIKKLEERIKAMEVGFVRKAELIKIKESLEQEKSA